VLDSHLHEFRGLPNTAAIFCPDGRLPEVGEVFVQADLAGTLQYLADEERAAAGQGGRDAGIAAARRAFYQGDIAAAIVGQQEAEGGFMTRADLAGFRAEIETATRARFGGYDLYGCGPWSQGPMILAAAQMLDRIDLKAMGHNSPAYVHAVTEALKLAAADREAYFGDPAQIKVPLDRLLDEDYVATRRAMIDPAKASPGMPAPGPIEGFDILPWRPDPSSAPHQTPALLLETSYFCVMDRDGNMFSATPSDPTISGDVVPGTGITTSRWGSRAHTGPYHPARVGPGWRPRMSANPMLAVKSGEIVMPFGSPGSEVLGQAQLQVMLNILVFGMGPQAAVEAPRFASYSWPASALPHTYYPARLNLEEDAGRATGDALALLGHDVQWWPSLAWPAGSVCVIQADLRTGLMLGGADPRRAAAAGGW
jgi:gamma-glutamyltranspeptidase / glutathione hydrolase